LPQAVGRRAIYRTARARTAVKDGSEPRIQLELALLKAVQPQADLSVQALLFRIEQLERKLDSSGDASSTGRRASNPAPEPPAPSSPPPAPRAAAGGGGAAQAVAAPDEEPEEGLDIELVRGLWPAALDAVRADNAMVAALLGEARPSAIAGSELTVSFPEGAEFSRKKADANSGLLQAALRGLTGRSVTVKFDLSAPPPGEGEPLAAMSEDELLERLKAEFKAEEVFDDGEGT
jgi:DNA polymerase-3 subunit gamma/tau